MYSANGEPPPKPPSTNPQQERFSFKDATRTRFSPLPPPPPPEFVTLATATQTWQIGAAKFPNVQVAIAVSLQAVNQEMATSLSCFLVMLEDVELLAPHKAFANRHHR